MAYRRRIALAVVVTCTTVAVALAYRWLDADRGPTAEEFRVYAAFLTRLSADRNSQPGEMAIARTTFAVATPHIENWVPVELRLSPADTAPPLEFVDFCGSRCGHDFIRKNLRVWPVRPEAQFPFDIMDASALYRTTGKHRVVSMSRPGFDLMHHRAVLMYSVNCGGGIAGRLCAEAGEAFLEKVNGAWKVARYERKDENRVRVVKLIG